MRSFVRVHARARPRTPHIVMRCSRQLRFQLACPAGMTVGPGGCCGNGEGPALAGRWRLMFENICELVLESRDLGALERFYRRLGLTVLAREDDRVWLVAGGRSRLGIWSPGRKDHADRGGRHVHFALSTARGTLERLTSELRDDGIAVEGPIEHDGGDRSI